MKKFINKNTDELTLKQMQKMKKSKEKSQLKNKDVEDVDPVDNNDRWKDSFQVFEKSLIDLVKTFGSEISDVNQKHELSQNARNKIEEFYSTTKKNLEVKRKLYNEFTKYKSGILEKELNSKMKKKASKSKLNKTPENSKGKK